MSILRKNIPGWLIGGIGVSAVYWYIALNLDFAVTNPGYDGEETFGAALAYIVISPHSMILARLMDEELAMILGHLISVPIFFLLGSMIGTRAFRDAPASRKTSLTIIIALSFIITAVDLFLFYGPAAWRCDYFKGTKQESCLWKVATQGRSHYDCERMSDAAAKTVCTAIVTGDTALCDTLEEQRVIGGFTRDVRMSCHAGTGR